MLQLMGGQLLASGIEKLIELVDAGDREAGRKPKKHSRYWWFAGIWQTDGRWMGGHKRALQESAATLIAIEQ